MKVAFICFDRARFTFLHGLYKAFKDDGHEVQAFYQHDVLEDHQQLMWISFELAKLNQFQPDRVIMFNGYAKESVLATSFIKSKYNTWFVERGWLPQREHIFIDPDGLGGRSLLSKTNLSVHTPDNDDSWLYLKGLYAPVENPNIGDYILVPLQIEEDTQITIDSPYVKTMRSLVDYVRYHFYDYKVVVRPHPKGPPFIARGHEVVTYADTNSLMANAKAIVGINSTSLIEGLVHEKPILSLGNSVVMSSDVMYRDLSRPRGVLQYKPSQTKIKAVLDKLLHTQFHISCPPIEIIKRVEEG